MGFPTRACREPTSDDAMKQSLRLVSDVSLSMSWKAESLPAGEREGTGGQVGGVLVEREGGGLRRRSLLLASQLQIYCSAGKLSWLIVTLRYGCCVSSQLGRVVPKLMIGSWRFLFSFFWGRGVLFGALAGTIPHGEAACKQGAPSPHTQTHTH